MINTFKGQYSFLSNFYNTPVSYEGVLYKNSESAYQSAKTTDPNIRKKFTNLEGSEAKKYGNLIKIRDDWEVIKDMVMYDVCLDKFMRNSYIKNKLLNTGNLILKENNNHKDSCWGIYCGEGLNKLGNILMRIRYELQCSIGVYTTNINNKDISENFVNITRKSGVKEFAPTWDMIIEYKSNKMSKYDYINKYKSLMKESYKCNKSEWYELLYSRDIITLGCYCKPHEFCHRYILKDIIEILCNVHNIKFYYLGELL